MKPQVQSRTGKNGRCIEACFASILEIPESQVPDFGQDDVFLRNVQAFLKPYGLYYVQVPVNTPGIQQAFRGGKIFHTIEGKSPRGGLHACVGESGKMVWDPHPQDGTGRGLVRIDCFGLLCARGE
jgi:hypothetical protein